MKDKVSSLHCILFFFFFFLGGDKIAHESGVPYLTSLPGHQAPGIDRPVSATTIITQKWGYRCTDCYMWLLCRWWDPNHSQALYPLRQLPSPSTFWQGNGGQGLSLNQAGLKGQGTPREPSVSYLPALGFHECTRVSDVYLGTGYLNSGPHAYTASILLLSNLPRPNTIYFQRLKDVYT